MSADAIIRCILANSSSVSSLRACPGVLLTSLAAGNKSALSQSQLKPSAFKYSPCCQFK